MVPFHIPFKPQTKGNRSYSVGNKFNNQHQWSKKNDGPKKVFNMANKALGPYPLVVVIDENKNPHSKSGIEIFCRRQKTWDKADKIVAKNDHKGRDHEGEIPFGVFFSHDVFG